MSTYRFTGKCGNNQVEVVTSNPTVLERELDRYLTSFFNNESKTLVIDSGYIGPNDDEPQDYFSESFKSHLKAKQEKPKQTQEPEIISLGDFLFNNDSTDLFDEFITCAYYIKKILGQDSFTLKFLNSKFYPVTGRLADFSIAAEAKKRNLIDFNEENGNTRYTLNENGELFFLNQING